ncbi:MAG: hypothetical protein ACMUIM_04240 [bacterium]
MCFCKGQGAYEVFGPQYKIYDLNIKEFEVIIPSPDVTRESSEA